MQQKARFLHRNAPNVSSFSTQVQNWKEKQKGSFKEGINLPTSLAESFAMLGIILSGSEPLAYAIIHLHAIFKIKLLQIFQSP